MRNDAQDTYDAYEKDIAIASFYFEEPTAYEYSRYVLIRIKLPLPLNYGLLLTLSKRGENDDNRLSVTGKGKVIVTQSVKPF